MKVYIEGAKYQYGKMILVGWAAGSVCDSYAEVRINAGGQEVPAELERRYRPDIRDLFFYGEGEGLYGFRAAFTTEDVQCLVVLTIGGEEKIVTFAPGYVAEHKTLPPEGMKARLKQLLSGKSRSDSTKSAPIEPLAQNPLISIVVPAYRTEPDHLREMIDSIVAQTYTNWELCLADGSGVEGPSTVQQVVESYYQEESRIRLQVLPENKGISGNTNEAFAMAKGEWIAMLDHDDLLTPDALYEVVKSINRNPKLDFIYTDSDLTDEDSIQCYNPLRKPAWSPEMMYSANYITHFSVIRKEILEQIGGWRAEFDGAQDWDLFFRVSEATKNIENIPKVLYHWRAAATSTAKAVETKPYAVRAQLYSIEEHLKRIGRNAQVVLTDTAAHCIRVIPEKTDKEVVILKGKGCGELSKETIDELTAWASQMDIGLVMPCILNLDGRIYSEGYQYYHGETPLYQGKTLDSTDEYGTACWYRNIDYPETICLAVRKEVMEKLGSPMETNIKTYCETLKAEDLRCLMTPFAHVTLTE